MNHLKIIFSAQPKVINDRNGIFAYNQDKLLYLRTALKISCIEADKFYEKILKMYLKRLTKAAIETKSE
jgi:hypothetical protein